MDWLSQIDVNKFLLFTLVLTRVSGLTITAPIYGSTEIPMRVRVMLSFALAYIISILETIKKRRNIFKSFTKKTAAMFIPCTNWLKY